MNSHCLLLVCKVPLEGKSKTRLIKELGIKYSRSIALAMLQDILTEFNISSLHNIDRYWFFSPYEALSEANSLLHSVDCGNSWYLDPNRSQRGVRSGLSEVLFALYEKYSNLGYQSITFIGGDSPLLRSEELFNGIDAANNGDCYICPASDGGYTLLTLPALDIAGDHQNSNIFENIRWSTEFTCIDQIQQLRKCFGSDDNFSVRVGSTYHDIDDKDGLEYLRSIHTAASNHDNSNNNSSSSSTLHGEAQLYLKQCRHTRNVLNDI